MLQVGQYKREERCVILFFVERWLDAVRCDKFSTTIYTVGVVE